MLKIPTGRMQSTKRGQGVELGFNIPRVNPVGCRVEDSFEPGSPRFQIQRHKLLGYVASLIIHKSKENVFNLFSQYKQSN